MDGKNTVNPYRPLGKQLKALRDRANETLAEASGAVEIDVRQLEAADPDAFHPLQILRDALLGDVAHGPVPPRAGSGGVGRIAESQLDLIRLVLRPGRDREDEPGRQQGRGG